MIEIIPNWHPIFVHFTVALISISALCYFIGFFTKRHFLGKELLIVGRWCLWFGAVAAIATIIAGFVAYYSVAHDTLSHEAITIHRNWAIATFIVILMTAAWSTWMLIKRKSASFVFVLFMVFAFSLVSVTAWHGAELVYRYGIGVMSLPQAEEAGHKDKTIENHPSKVHKHDPSEKH